MEVVWWRIPSILHPRRRPGHDAHTGTTRSSTSHRRPRPAPRTFVMSPTQIILANRTAITVTEGPRSILPVPRPLAYNTGTTVSRIRRRQHRARITTAMCALCRSPPARHRRHHGAPRTFRRSRPRHHQYSHPVGVLRNILRFSCKVREGEQHITSVQSFSFYHLYYFHNSNFFH